MPPMENAVPPPSLSAFSSTTARWPAARAASAVATPAMPEPITTTSYVSSKLMALLSASTRSSPVLWFGDPIHAPPRIQEYEAPRDADLHGCCRTARIRAGARRCGADRSGGVSNPPGQARRPVPAGWPDRPDGAHLRPEARRALGP